MRPYLLLLVILLPLALLGCSSESEIPPTPIIILPSVTVASESSTPQVTALLPTATAPLATDLPATLPATANLFPPTITPTITTATLPPVPRGVDQRLEFPPGAVSTSVEQSVVRETQDRYILWAQAGQTMEITLSSLENNAVVTVQSPDGTLLAENISDQWQGRLSLSGDYQIEVASTRGNASYRLAVTIPPGSTITPTRIQFAPGASAATVSGYLEENDNVDAYILGAAAGQAITVDVSPADGSLFVELRDASGQSLATADNGRLQARLPATQDYVLTIASDVAGGLGYSLTVAIQ